MAKSDSSRTVKKTAQRTFAEPASNGHASNGHASNGHPTPRVRLVKSSNRTRRGSSEPIIALPEGYRPTENEPFMNERHKVYFRNKLVAWKEEIVRQNRETLHLLHEDSAQHADFADRATSETDRALELRARDRQRKLIAKIDAALARIEDGSYGYCEETGEPIGLRRLDARPIATLSLEAQERHERRERVYRED
jgi:DnaK suppressor protein